MTKLTPAQQQWIDALRSGKYTQGTGHLWSQEGSKAPVCYCCLGVAMKELLPESPDLEPSAFGNFSAFSTPMDSAGEFIDKLGLHDGGGSVTLPISEWNKVPKVRNYVQEFATDDAHTIPLWQLNDTYGLTFNEIADFIEAHAEEVFKNEPRTS